MVCIVFAAINIPALPAPSYSYTAVSQPLSTPSLGSLPSSFVHSAVALPALNNQRGGQSGLVAPLAQTAPQTASQTTYFNLNVLANTGGSPDFSSAFFTQLLAQSNAETQATIANSFSTLHAGDPEILTAFSNVKYMPSAAAKPQPQSARVEPLQIQSVPSEQQQIRVQAQQQQQVQQQQAAAPQAERSFATVVMRSSYSYAPIIAAPQRRSETQGNTEDTLRRDRSFLPKEAAAAYERAATYAVTPKPVEAADKGNTN